MYQRCTLHFPLSLVSNTKLFCSSKLIIACRVIAERTYSLIVIEYVCKKTHLSSQRIRLLLLRFDRVPVCTAHSLYHHLPYLGTTRRHTHTYYIGHSFPGSVFRTAGIYVASFTVVRKYM